MRAKFLTIAFALFQLSYGAEAQIPGGVALPPGMSPSQAATVAAQNGVTIGADGKPQLPPGMTVEQAKSLAQQNGAVVPDAGPSGAKQGESRIPSTEKDVVDPTEGEAAAPKDELASIERTLDTDPSRLRWGQRLFRTGSASLASGHVGAIGPEYALGPGDEIIVTIWGQKEARYTLELDRDGQVSMEYVGVVSLNGQTLKSAEELLRRRAAKVYAGLNDGTTQMDVTMGKLKQIRVFVVGDVVQPGSYMLSGNTSVLAALFLAKGPSDLGSERRVEIRRGSSVVKVDLYDYLARGRRADQDVLRDGDVVHVGRHFDVVEIQGAVGRPGFYELLSEEGVKELLQYAGGTSLTAADHPLAAVRTYPGERRDVVLLRKPSDYVAGQNSDLSDRDQIMVYQGNDPTQATVVASGEFRYPGPYPWVPGLTLGELLAKAGGPSPSVVPGIAFIRRVRSDGTVYMTRERYDSSLGSSRLLLPLDTISLLNRFQFTEGGTVTISGAVRNPRSVGFRPGMTLRDLVILANGFKKVEPPQGLANPRDSIARSRIDTLGNFDLDTLLWFPAGVAFIQRKTGDAEGKVESFTLAPVPEVPLAEGDVVQIVDPLAPRIRETVRVSGMVPNPGLQPGLEGLRVRDAILRAGGFMVNADPSRVRLEYPKDFGGAVVEELRLDSALTTPDAFRLLPRGAQVAVPRRLDREVLEVVEITGEVYRPGVYALQTYQERLSSLIGRAGGLQELAYLDGARLLRHDLAGRGRIVIDLRRALKKPGSVEDIVLTRGDSLHIPRQASTVNVVGQVNRPGLVPWRKGASWKDYVALAGGYRDSANTDGVFVEQANGKVETRSEGISTPLPGSTIEVPYKVPPEPVTYKEILSGINMVLATVIAGLTIFVLLQK